QGLQRERGSVHGRGHVLPLGVEEVAAQGFLRCEPDGVHDAVEAVDVSTDTLGQGGELLVVGDIELQDRGCHGQTFGDAFHQAHATVAGENHRGALFLGQAGGVEGDGGVGEHPGDEDAFTFEESHGPVMSVLCSGGGRKRGGSVAHAEATVDGDDRAGDVVAPGSGEETDGAGDVGGLADTAQRNALLDLVPTLLGKGVGHVGLDEAGGDDVDGDVAGAQFTGQGAGKTDESGLGGGVVGLSSGAEESHHRGDQDDAATAFAHHAAHCAFGQAEGAGEVGVEDGGEVVLAHEGKELVLVDTRVGHQYLDRPLCLLHLFEGGIDLGGVGDVATDTEQAFRRLPGSVGHRDVVSTLSQFTGDGQADSPVAAGDQYRARHRKAPHFPAAAV